VGRLEAQRGVAGPRGVLVGREGGRPEHGRPVGAFRHPDILSRPAAGTAYGPGVWRAAPG
jgi:hypothetical protein